MLRFGVWNINGVYRNHFEASHLAAICAHLAIAEDLDFFIAIETGDQAAVIARQLRSAKFNLVFDDSRFALLTRLNPGYVSLVACPVQTRSRTFSVNMPLQLPFLLTVVHGRDSQHAKPGTQTLVLRRIVENVIYSETLHGHNRSIVLGDFNCNPFDAPALASDGLHAIMSKREAARIGRTVSGERSEFFYNPSFRLLDASDDQPPASFFYAGSDTVEAFWHMLDQVVVRPSLIPHFDSSSFRIVRAIAGIELLKEDGRPNMAVGSDHLPLVFAMNVQLKIGGD